MVKDTPTSTDEALDATLEELSVLSATLFVRLEDPAQVKQEVLQARERWVDKTKADIKSIIQAEVQRARVDELTNFEPLQRNHDRCPDVHTCIGYQNAASDFDNEKEIRLAQLTDTKEGNN